MILFKRKRKIRIFFISKKKKFFKKISEKNASVCGFGPIAIAMVAAKELGAKKGELFKYATSGDITGELGSVVGYASLKFY